MKNGVVRGRYPNAFFRAWVACFAASGVAFIAVAEAQSYPAKPIPVVVPFPPGGVDVTVRQMRTVMTNDLGQQLVIDIRAGANGYIGPEMVARGVQFE